MILRLGQVIVPAAIAIQYVPVFFDKANQTIAVRHTLKSSSVGWSLASVDKFCKIKDATVGSTQSSILLQSDTDRVRAIIRLEAVNWGER